MRLPPFSSIALKFIQFIDPGLKADIYCDRPWAFSPLIATMNTVNVSGWHLDKATQKKVEEHGQEEDKERLENELPPWPSPQGEHIVEDTTLIFQPDHHNKEEHEGPTSTLEGETAHAHEHENKKEELTMAPTQPTVLNTSARRSHFAKEANLVKHRYRTDQVYGFDFFNPYLDFANFTLKVPGFSVDITKYWDGQVKYPFGGMHEYA